ncbi:uncharacterized protein P884DRAFT_245810 [Thermothelomyces heterothallicus CBS 202.75]|uniref:uncharacterized protein n=1 Tax=Thermothelomyces heterothallicus CBS 202.75 TaxID=1149848 RepID=UPI003743E678
MSSRKSGSTTTLRVPSNLGPMSHPNSLYITMQYLRTVNRVNQFHWALYATENEPPSGYLIHATNANRSPPDLYSEFRSVSDPRKSRSMLVFLKIAKSPGLDALRYAASAVRLTDKRALPPGEPRWTCRVWVKEVLRVMEENQFIKLPMSIDALEERCLYMGDKHIPDIGNAPMYNDLRWVSSNTGARKALIDPSEPMDTEPAYPTYHSEPPAGRYYGPKPMITDPAGRYYGPKPMVTEPAHSSQPVSERYYGPKPMVTDTYY